jgi:magnesium-transporting ATPase (P-type)
MLPSQVTVLRDGAWLSVPAAALVPGDIVQIRAGNKIPADLRLCEASLDLKFNRSILTGEADAIKGSVNSTNDNFLEVQLLFSGVLIIRPAVLPCKGLTVSLDPGLEYVYSQVITLSLAKLPNSRRNVGLG